MEFESTMRERFTHIESVRISRVKLLRFVFNFYFLKNFFLPIISFPGADPGICERGEGAQHSKFGGFFF